MGELRIAAGAIIGERYALNRRIGSGGMGEVYEATHIVTRRPCAIKLMIGHSAEREEMRTRFFRESRALAQIESEYIVSVLDAGVDAQTHVPFLVMELLRGIDLGQLVMAKGALPASDVLLYLWHTALALDKTHQSAIVHRDLKASNLFLTEREDGSPLVKVLDFGIAKMLRLDGSSERNTQAVGTPLYMAPEQFQAKGRVSTATDIYALGMLAYLLLVGKHYWREERESCENPFAFGSIAAKGPLEPASVRAERCDMALPASFDAWFARATALRPEDRFSSAILAVSELCTALGLPLPGPAPAPNVRSPASRTRNAGSEHGTLSSAAWKPQDSGVVLAPAMSFTDSLPLIDADESRRSDATEMPLSVTHASLGPSDSRRHWPWLVAVCAVAAAVVGAARLHDEHVPPPVLARGLASPDLGFAVQTASVPPTRPVQEAAPTDTPLTPSDLELAAPEIAPSNLGRVQNAVSHRALDAPRAFAMKPKVVKSSPQPKAPEPAAPEAALPVIDRAALYRRD